MGCRRKLKKERELVADIRKVFQNFCNQRECRDCPYSHNTEDCIIAYVIDLMKKYNVTEEEE